MKKIFFLLSLMIFLTGCAEYVAVQVLAPPDATISNAPVPSGSGSGHPVFVVQLQDARADRKIVSDTGSAPLLYRTASIIPDGQSVSDILTNQLKRHLVGSGFYIADALASDVTRVTGVIRKYNLSLGMWSWKAYVDLIINVNSQAENKPYSLHGESSRTNWGAKSGVEALDDALAKALAQLPTTKIIESLAVPGQ